MKISYCMLCVYTRTKCIWKEQNVYEKKDDWTDRRERYISVYKICNGVKYKTLFFIFFFYPKEGWWWWCLLSLLRYFATYIHTHTHAQTHIQQKFVGIFFYIKKDGKNKKEILRNQRSRRSRSNETKTKIKKHKIK